MHPFDILQKLLFKSASQLTTLVPHDMGLSAIAFLSIVQLTWNPGALGPLSAKQIDPVTSKLMEQVTRPLHNCIGRW